MISMPKLLRIIHEDTQTVIANELGCTLTSYNLKENGKAKFTLEEMKILSKRYNTSIERLTQDGDTKEKIIGLLQA